MQLEVSDNQLVKAVDKIMKKRGYQPFDSIQGRTISLHEFAHKYCYPHGVDWAKENILYRFKPSWVVNIHPGHGKGFTIFEDEAATWMAKHRKEIDWDA